MSSASRSGEWEAINAILDAALELPSQERIALLDKRCAGDPELRREVEALLDACDSDGGFLEAPAGEFAASLIAAEERFNGTGADARVMVGPYRLTMPTQQS